MTHTLRKRMVYRHSHKYICERCKKEKSCNITGCRGECASVCGKCITARSRELRGES